MADSELHKAVVRAVARKATGGLKAEKQDGASAVLSALLRLEGLERMIAAKEREAAFDGRPSWLREVCGQAFSANNPERERVFRQLGLEL